MRDYIPKTLNGLSKQIAKDVYKKVGNKIAKDMTHEYIAAIRSFYNDYHPVVYKRKYRSYYFADSEGVKTYTKFVKPDSDGEGFTVTLRLSPDNIKAPYSSIVNGKGTRTLTNLVFTNTWVYGQHGGRLPWNILPEDNRPDNWHNQIWEPPVMDISPMEQMDIWFSNYATNNNLNKLTQNVVTNSINRYLRRWKG